MIGLKLAGVTANSTAPTSPEEWCRLYPLIRHSHQAPLSIVVPVQLVRERSKIADASGDPLRALLSPDFADSADSRIACPDFISFVFNGDLPKNGSNT